MPGLDLRVRAPAKLNLCLLVGRAPRPDGLHEICSIFQSISLADELAIRAAGRGGDRIECSAVEGPNLIETALTGYRSATRWPDFPVTVEVQKRIPVAGGLGGGSADAAAVLRALNAVAPSPLDPGAVARLAMRIGADVPSQIEPGMYLVGGAGERLTSLSDPKSFGIVLVPAAGGLSTAAVYATADRIGSTTADVDAACAELAADLRREISVEQLAGHVRNDLQAGAIDLLPAIQDTLAALRSLAPLACAVTGSGPTAFALFRTVEEAESALAGNPIPGALVAEPVDERFGVPKPATAAAARRM